MALSGFNRGLAGNNYVCNYVFELKLTVTA